MNRLIRSITLLLLVLLTIAPLTAQEDEGGVTLEPYTDDTFNLEGFIPSGWENAGPGTYVRGTPPTDFAVYLAQAITGTAADFQQLLTPQLGLTSFPEPTDTLETDAFAWNIYDIEVEVPGLGSINVVAALAEADDQAYLVLLQAPPADFETLREQVFVPALEALRPGGAATVPDVDQSTFTETEVEFGLEDWRLPGTLTTPVGDGPFPAVVLVHGSGPNDRDETLGPNKMFRDLAWGLAEQGIAVLRYDKRTLVYRDAVTAENMDVELTLDFEVTEDALEAVNFLREQDNIGDIFVIGHSLGGMLIPRIAEQAGEDQLSGVVILAGNAQYFGELLLEQATYLNEFWSNEEDSPNRAAALQQLAQTEALAEDLLAAREGGELSDIFADETQATYWGSYVDYDQTAVAQGLELPMLILQGERDYQVTMEEYTLWQAALEGQDNVTFMSYPDLNHYFMSQGDLDRLAVPTDYNERGFMAQEVIDDIAEWIMTQ
ncbi:MAG: hypothetical protein OHK0046_52230 [Anaerolineae bacterium]